jgi:DNA-binding beta-propeller fold protein YncE
MPPSLTTSAAGRTYDFSHVVGGRQITGVVNMAFGENDDVYVTKKALAFFDVELLKIGKEPGDEEVIQSFRAKDFDLFENSWPSCVAVGPNLDVYVTDELRHLIMVFDHDGNFIRNIGEHGDQPGQFDRPSGIVFANDGSLYVSDTKNHRIQHLTTTGEVITTFGEPGTNKGQFNSPWGIDLDAAQNVLVADHVNNRIQKFDSTGNYISAIETPGSGAGELNHPSDVTTDPDGNIYICDWANNRVQVFDESENYVLQMGGSAVELSKWQKRYIQGNPDVYKARRRVDTLDPETGFALPTGVEFDTRTNRLFVVDSQRWRIQIFNKLEDYAEPQFNI